MFELKHISVHVKNKTLLDNISLAFSEPHFCAIVGPNGAGKTTLLNTLAGNPITTSGEIFFKQQPLKKWKTQTLACNRAVLTQHTNLNFPFTVYDVVKMGRLPHNESNDRTHTIINKVLKICHCDQFSTQAFPVLSGGEKQRVQIARAISQVYQPDPQQTRFLFLDEPISALDLKYQYQALGLLKKLTQDNKIGVICVIHNINLAAQFADRCIILHNGKIVCDNAPKEALKADTLSAVFDMNLVSRPHPSDPTIPLILPSLSPAHH